MEIIVAGILVYLLVYLCSQGVDRQRTFGKKQRKKRKYGQHKSKRRARSSRYRNPRAKRKARKRAS